MKNIMGSFDTDWPNDLDILAVSYVAVSYKF